MMYQYLKNQSGFSLVEMLVSITILLLVIIGPMTIIARTAKSSTYATEQVQAFFLAQEGLELAQKARDDRLLSSFVTPGTPWSDFKTDGTYANCFNGNGCGLEWHNTTAGALATPVSCSPVTDCRIYQKSATGRSRFTYSAVDNSVSNTPTPYTRVIKFSNTNDGKAVKVVSSVTWQTGTLVASQRVETETYLYNIYDSN
ncbi:MAG: prepilin-type N-terminal cleavage/methylation domain-containing protein [Candidatus Paceibacterota bacterium]